MSESNLAAVLHGKRDLRVEEHPISEPGPGQVQLCMSHVGICGSDLHFWQDGDVGDLSIKSPMVVGHEGAGVVSKLGEGVTHLSVGDRVAIEPVMNCRLCEACKKGRYNLCCKRKVCSSPPTHGHIARYYVHDADHCFKLPKHVTTEEGALLEPLSVAVHACGLGGVGLGSTVLICGAGTIGLVSLLTAKASGASKVCVTDIDQKRLDKARELGADYTLKVSSGDPREFACNIENVMEGQPDVTIECSGAPTSVQASVYATKPGGCMMIVGIGADVTPVPLIDVVLREIQIRGNGGYANCYPTALAMVASGKVDVKPLITHRFKLEEAVKAFETALGGEGIKVMIKCSRD